MRVSGERDGFGGGGESLRTLPRSKKYPVIEGETILDRNYLVVKVFPNARCVLEENVIPDARGVLTQKPFPMHGVFGEKQNAAVHS